MKPLHALRSSLAILGAVVALAAIACALPDTPYQRWQLLDGTIHAKARWIYERSHFDPTPIDVAFIGSSRIGAGINAPRLAQDLAALGQPENVVNFSMPESGRNINFAIVEEMLKEKHPKLIVIGVYEKPSRFGHSAFKYIARPELIENPGYLGNLNYLSDFIYLPFRQMRLFLANILPGGTGLRKTFDPGAYLGPTVDTTGNVILPGGVIKDGERPASAAELARGVNKLERGSHKPFLPARFADMEFGDERYYTRRIVDLARAKGVPVAFLFVPYYTGPDAIQERAFYTRYGPLWDAGFLASHSEWFADYAHMTRTGAEHLTDWVASPVATFLSGRDKAR